MKNSPKFNAISEKGDRTDSFQEGWNYEATVAEVEEILAQIESGELELAAVFDRFSRAVEYLRQCEAFLAQRQKQVDLLIDTLTDEQEF